MAKIPSSAFSGIDLRRFGGVPVAVAGAKLKDLINDPDAAVWNFGIAGAPGLIGPPAVMSSAPSFYDVAPKMQGVWDGKTTYNPHALARKVFGKEIPAQQQPKGTCGGRTGKMSGQLLQGVMAVLGNLEIGYKPVSHAWLYALARREYGMLGSGDGVPDGSIPPVMAKYGLLNAEEAGDTNDYGQGSDDLAARWGGRSGPPEKFFEVAADNKVEGSLVKVRSIQEYADACAGGGVGLVSSMRGFTMQRDANGICRPSGTWAHYMSTSGITLVNGQVIVPIPQSWGRNTPSGPKLMGSGNDGGWPDYVFGAEAEVFERDMIKRGSVHVIFAYPAWDIKPRKLDWSKAA